GARERKRNAPERCPPGLTTSTLQSCSAAANVAEMERTVAVWERGGRFGSVCPAVMSRSVTELPARKLLPLTSSDCGEGDATTGFGDTLVMAGVSVTLWVVNDDRSDQRPSCAPLRPWTCQ